MSEPELRCRSLAGHIPGPTCSDGTQNGDETGADCGGSCPACALALFLNEYFLFLGTPAGDAYVFWDGRCEVCSIGGGSATMGRRTQDRPRHGAAMRKTCPRSTYKLIKDPDFHNFVGCVAFFMVFGA